MGGTLLTSTTVTNASTQFNGYLYTAISPIVLNPGNYLIAGTTLGLNDGWIYQATTTGNAGLVYDTSWFSPGNGGMLSFPTNQAPGRQYMEVNFLISPLGGVPEPGTIMMVGTGLLGCLGVIRRRRSL